MKRGFTLIELIIVILILGILSSIALPRFLNVKKKAEAARVISDFRVILAATQLCYAENGEYPPDYYPGGVPYQLRPYLNENFSFDLRPTLDVRYDWENWVVDGKPMHPHTGILYGISVTTGDMALINAIDELYSAGFKYSLGQNYTFVIAYIPTS